MRKLKRRRIGAERVSAGREASSKGRDRRLVACERRIGRDLTNETVSVPYPSNCLDFRLTFCDDTV
jgi:hypothetical protein